MRSWPIFAALLAMTQGAAAQVPPDPANGAKLATELCMRQKWVCEGERMRSVEPDPQ